MKKYFRLIIVFMLSILALQLHVYAETEYAYSLGHDFGKDLWWTNKDYEGDFTMNVDYASTTYEKMGYVSHKSYNPTYTYISGDNPTGDNRLGSSIIFINGHASYDRIILGDTIDDDKYKCGIYKGKDFKSSSSEYTFAGLEERDLSKTKLISFVGCKTATTSDNLCTAAIEAGATTAIGFTGAIHSRNMGGPNWLQSFHDALYNGSTVKEAVNLASIASPESDLGTDIVIYGDENLILKITPEKLNEDGINELDDTIIESKKTQFNTINYDTSNFKSRKGKFNLNQENVQLNKKNILNTLGIIADSDIEKYKLICNEYQNGTGNGLIKITYYIDDIKTSDQTALIVNNNILQYSSNTLESQHKVKINEEDIIAKRDQFLKKVDVIDLSNKINEQYVDAKVIEETNEFYYDYSDNKLYYVIDKVFSYPDSNGMEFTETQRIEVNE
ncbi:hypothetical protein SH1V18_20860 [Vallitalea longa]|uniref:CHAT domain-containing protein n=1 Tax=Vallitalea longa TaxID=2936439 RepID=A0A9W5YBT7_9FIRM|nr:hypothetical protein [Vallitalea longa]GKX29606.1 hypothetical protein SH1V18_20860 [Vallitalea longa]